VIFSAGAVLPHDTVSFRYFSYEVSLIDLELVKEALKGYSEISEPEILTYNVEPGENSTYSIDVEDVQNWIYETAEIIKQARSMKNV
jgi:hypothetical protein